MSWSEKSDLVFRGLLFFCLILLMKITITQLLFHYVGRVLLGKPSWSHFHDERFPCQPLFSRIFQNSEFIAKSHIFCDLYPYRPCQELCILISFLELWNYHLLGFFEKKVFFASLRFPALMQTMLSKWGKWSEMENSSKSVAATTPLRTSLPPPLSCRTLTPNSNRNFKNPQRMSQLFDI